MRREADGTVCNGEAKRLNLIVQALQESRSWVFRYLQTTSEMYHPRVTREEFHFCQ